MTETPYAQIVAPYASALRMIREAIEELFGPAANLESEEAVLLRGPEPHHDAEAIIAALQRLSTPTTMTEADGWKLVPEEPTLEMISAFDMAERRKRADSMSPQPTEEPEAGGGPIGYGYRAMIAAAPPAPAPDDLRELREAAGRATPGPWRRYHEAQVIRPDGGRVCKAHFERDTTFIARANPSTVLSLIDRIARLESENARLRRSSGEILATIIQLRDKHSSPTGDAYTCGLWDQSQRIFGKVEEIARAAVSEPKP